VVMGLINLHVLYGLLSGRLRADELVQVREAEGLADAEEQLREVKT